MKKLLKVFALLVVCAMTFAAFTACTEPKEPAVTTGAAVDPATTVAPATTAEPVTQAPATTAEPGTQAPATTEAPKELNMVYRWDFDSDDSIGWSATSSTKKLSTADGAVLCECTGGDPNISTQKMPIEIDCETVEYIRMRVKNCTDSYSAQLFISTSDSPGPAEAYSYKFDYEYADEDNEEWEIVEIDCWDIPGWTGSLKMLRFDYCDGSMGNYYMDYFELVTTQAVEDKGEVTTVDLLAGTKLIKSFTFADGDEAKWDAAMAAELELPEESEERPTADTWKKCYYNSEDMPTSIESWQIDNSILKMTIYGEDPFIMSPDLTKENIYCEQVKVIVVKACNKTDNSAAQLFFTTIDADGIESEYSEAGSFHLYYDKVGADNEAYETFIISTTECADYWVDQLTSIRFDITQAQEGQVWLQSIELYG